MEIYQVKTIEIGGIKMTKFFESLAFFLLFGSIPSVLLIVFLGFMNIKDAPWLIEVIKFTFFAVMVIIVGCGLFLLCGMLFKEINK